MEFQSTLFNRNFNKQLIQKFNRKFKTKNQKNTIFSIQYFPEHRILVAISFLVFTIDFRSKQNMYADCLILLLILDLKLLFLFYFWAFTFWGHNLCLEKGTYPAPLFGQEPYLKPKILYRSLIPCLFVWLVGCLVVCLYVCLFVFVSVFLCFFFSLFVWVVACFF